jgi:hypothetical protein
MRWLAISLPFLLTVVWPGLANRPIQLRRPWSGFEPNQIIRPVGVLRSRAGVIVTFGHADADSAAYFRLKFSPG